MPVNSAEDAMKIAEYYIQRWKIERFHFTLKSGCNVAQIQQRTYEKIKAMLLIYSVIAMYIMAITYWEGLFRNPSGADLARYVMRRIYER